MTNFNLDNLSEIIDEILTEFCVTYPIPDFSSKEQLEHLRSVLEQFGAETFTDVELMEAISLAPKKFTLEAPKQDGTDPKLAAILKKKVLNKDTGREVTVASALNYKDQKGAGARAAYHTAVGMLKQSGYSEKNVDMVDDPNPEEPQYYAKQKPQVTPQSKVKPQQTQPTAKPQQTQPTAQPTKKVTPGQQPVNVNLGGSLKDVFGRFEDNKNNKTSKDNVATAIKSVYKEVDKFIKDKKNPNQKDHIAVKASLQKMFGGTPLSASEKKLLAKYVRVAEPTDANPNACKVYIARQPGVFKTAGADKRSRVYVGAKDKSTPVIGAFRQWATKNGILELATSTFGGKKTTANQTFIDEKGNTKLLKGAAKVNRDKNGVVQAVKIGGLNIIRLDPNEKGIKPNERKLRERNNRNLEEYSTKIDANDMDFIDMDKGIVPDSPKNRVIVIQHAISGMANRFKTLADKAQVSDKETLALITVLDNFSKRDPNKNPKEWLKDFEHILSKIANHEGEPSLREGWANYAEIFVAIKEMQDNGNGTEHGKCALLPQSQTLETVDVITISDGMGTNRIVTLDGRSVKKGVGGASALTSKTRKSTYKNDPKGLIKKGVIALSESHNVPYGITLEQKLADHKKLNDAYQSEIKKKALALNIKPAFIKQMESEMKPGGRAAKKIASALGGIALERSRAGLPIDKDTLAKIKMRLESYYMYTVLAHEAYNENVDVQDFANDSVLSQKEDRGGGKLVKAGEIEIDSSNGIDILAYPQSEFNIGFSLDGKSKNPGAGRFHNAPKRQ
jgi:hypothetical protein